MQIPLADCRSIVTVPCPGADPHQTWTRDALLENFFSSSPWEEPELHETGKELLRTSIVSPVIPRALPKAVPSWVRQGIRKEANQARILLYSHQVPVEGTTLSKLADDLLAQLRELRGDEVGGTQLSVKPRGLTRVPA